MSVVFLRRGVGRFGTGRVAAELSYELSGASTARRHFIAKLTTYIVVVAEVCRVLTLQSTLSIIVYR